MAPKKPIVLAALLSILFHILCFLSRSGLYWLGTQDFHDTESAAEWY